MSNTQRGDSRKEQQAREIARRNERRQKQQQHAWFETFVAVEVKRDLR